MSPFHSNPVGGLRPPRFEAVLSSTMYRSSFFQLKSVFYHKIKWEKYFPDAQTPPKQIFCQIDFPVCYFDFGYAVIFRIPITIEKNRRNCDGAVTLADQTTPFKPL